MATLTQNQTKAFDTGTRAFNSFTASVTADDNFIQAMLKIVRTKASSYERKGFEAGALQYCVDHQVKGAKGLTTGSPEVKRLRAKLAKVPVKDGEQNWTVKFGTDGDTGIANACCLQRSVAAKNPAPTAKEADTASTISGVKNLDSLLDYAIDHYGMKAVHDNLSLRIDAELTAELAVDDSE